MTYQFFRREDLAWQIVLILIVWFFVCFQQADNDGLWFQGDAPRHAATGLFYKDYISDGFPNSWDYALSYYARYPVIRPTGYPPLFYLLEAAIYGMLGPSPYFPKMLVLFFALLAAFYITAWARYWIDAKSGWAGALFLLLPGIVMWSHSVMLNIPALALMIGALFHLSRWIDPRRTGNSRKDIYAMAGLGLAGILTYWQSSIVIAIAILWLTLFRRGRRLWDWRILVWLGTGFLLVALYLLFLGHLEPRIFRWFAPGSHLFTMENLLFYPVEIAKLSPLYILALSIVGIIIGWRNRDWHFGTILLLVWCAITYCVFSYLHVKDSRYVLPLVVPLVCFSVMTIVFAQRWLRRCAENHRCLLRSCSIIPILVIVIQFFDVLQMPSRSVSGFRQIVSYLQQYSPGGGVIYSGKYDGIFSFYMLAGDPGFDRGVILFERIPALAALSRKPDQYKPAELDEMIRELIGKGLGAGWIAIEETSSPAETQIVQSLRRVVKESDFEFTGSFQIKLKQRMGSVNLYRILNPAASPEHLEIFFPELGETIRAYPMKKP